MDAREQRYWPSVTIALFGVIAGYMFVNFPDGPSPAAENYVAQTALYEYAHGALLIVTTVAPLFSIVAAIIRRSLIGALAGFVAGFFGVIWVPANMRACCGGDEAGMIGMLRAINSAQQEYSSVCARDKGYARSLATLAAPTRPDMGPFINAEAATGNWRGYRLTMTIPDGAEMDSAACDGKRIVASYFVEAHLIDAVPGRRNFATDERGTIYSNRDGTVIQPGMAGAEPVQ